LVNMLVIGAVFIVLLLIIAGFVSQQLNTAQKIKESKRPKNLLEKMNKGIGALDTAKFRQIVMDSGPDAFGGQVESLLDEDDQAKVARSASTLGEMPDDMVIGDDLAVASGTYNLEGKDLQTIYSEYLSEKNLNPFELEPEFKLGVAYLKFSQFEKAISQFQKVIDDKPEFPGIHYYIGEAFRCNGQFYEAMKAYKQSWELDSRASQDNQAEQQLADKPSENIFE
jgi:tetratricopeptide (TPR) repeat protein